MSPLVLVYVVVVLLMAHALAEICGGKTYVCPSCGARGDGEHSEDCQWN